MQDQKDGSVKIDFNKEWWNKYDMTTLIGRTKHWFVVTDFRKSFTTQSTLD